MLKKLNQIINIVIGSFVGVFIGHGIYAFWDRSEERRVGKEC